MEYPILNFEATTIDKNNTRNTNKRHNNKLISQQKQIFLQDDLVQLKTKRKNPDVNTYNEYITLQKQQDEYIYKHQQKYIIDKQELNKCIIYTCNQYQEHIKKKEEYKKKLTEYMEQLNKINNNNKQQQQQFLLKKQEFKNSIKYICDQYKQNKNKEEYNKQIEKYINELKELERKISTENKHYTLEKQELNECIFYIKEQCTQCTKQIEEYTQQYNKYTQELKELENEKIRLESEHIKQMIILNNLYLNSTTKKQKI
jgi:hypothetical protein